jgi:hypothetical protein
LAFKEQTGLYPTGRDMGVTKLQEGTGYGGNRVLVDRWEIFVSALGNYKEIIGTILFSGKLPRVALVRIAVSEERIATIMLTRIGELGTTLTIPSNRSKMRRNTRL